MSWDYKARPVCYGYRYTDEEYTKIEFEVGVSDPEDPDSAIHFSIFHDDVNDDCVNTWAELPLSEAEELHTILGNLIELQKEKQNA